MKRDYLYLRAVMKKLVETAYKIGCKRFVGAGSQAEYGKI